MKVKDSNQIGLASSMPKKKHVKNSETSDEDTAKTDVHCSHVNKSVNINQVRKALRHSTVLGRCQLCYANNDSARKKPEKSDTCENISGDSLSPADELPSDYEPTVFFCLHCGHQGCDRYTPDKHALQHFETTARSVAHNIVLDLMSYQVWCYSCDKSIPVEASKKLLECADFVYHFAGHKDSITSFVKRPEIYKENGFGLEPSSPESPRDSDPVARDEANRSNIQTASGMLLKVKGLNNLGNTCFFNAVVQNLVQTELLESALRASCQRGHSIDLSISLQESATRSCPDDKTNGKEQEPKQDLHKEQDLHKVETLSLSLGECGMLTQSVVNLFEEMKASDKQSSVSPSALFGIVCKKAPRFKGFQQHDSHELLRHLLDAIKGEEIRRAHTSILNAFKSSEKQSSLKDIPDDLRSKIKAFGNQAKRTFVDSIFGGHFISTVVCQACDTHHQIFEPFLDISLPVIEEKPFKSRAQHSGKSEEDKNGLENAEAHSGEIKKSKHMSKKERQMAKKNAAKNRKGSGKTERQSRTNAVELSDPVASVTAADDVKSNAEEETVKTDDAKCDGGLSVETERHSGEEREGEDGYENVDDKVECIAEQETSIDKYQQVETSTCGELRNSSLESESSGADVEDNEESDASRYRVMENSIDTLPEGDRRKAEDDEAASNGLAEEHKELENSDDLTLDQIDTATNAIQSSGKNQENVDHIANGIVAMQLRVNSSPEDKIPSDQLSAAACNDSGSKEKMEVYNNARKAAMKTLVPREKPTGQECSVLSSLYQFTLSELLSGNNMYRCTVCNKVDKDGKAVQGQKSVLTYASQQFLIYSPPAVLTLHLKRFQQVGFNLRKITRHIEFSELLDLAPFCSALCQKIQTGQRRILYSLYGIVEHRGTLRSGHYTAYVKVRNSNPNTKRFLETLITSDVTVQHLVDAMQTAFPDIRAAMGEPETVNTEDNCTKHVVPPLGKWFYISDNTVSEVKSISNILSCQAYILFYERIE